MSEIGTYRWTGVNRNGEHRSGCMTMHATSLPAYVEGQYRNGWRFLRVCVGEGPVPPSFADQGGVAGIGKHPDTGKRTWWAEQAGSASDAPLTAWPEQGETPAPAVFDWAVEEQQARGKR